MHKESDRLELVKAIVHASDLSGQAMEPEVAYSFGKGVLAEFHEQAMREAREKLPETPFMKNLDDTLQQAKSQLGFINFVVEPLWCVRVPVRSCVRPLTPFTPLHSLHLPFISPPLPSPPTLAITPYTPFTPLHPPFTPSYTRHSECDNVIIRSPS